MNRISMIKLQDKNLRKDEMNVYDITTSKDPTKPYTKTIEESKCGSFEDYIAKVEKQTHKLQTGVFVHQGNFYFAKFKVVDLSERNHDPMSNTTTTICRKTKFKWNYQFLK